MKHHYHWPANETASSLDEAKKRELKRARQDTLDGLVFGAGALLAFSIWCAIVAIVKHFIQ